MSRATAVGAVSFVIVDCHDPDRLATFWSGLLGVGETERAEGWVDLGPIAEGGPQISFVTVPEAKSVKNRLHLDVRVRDLDEAGARAERLGATPISDVYGQRTHPWRVYADPEGNEFCLVTA